MTFVEPIHPITTAPVLVTGISGFIGLHVAATLISRGYAVRGSVRSPERVEQLRSALKRQGLNDELVTFTRLELTSDEGFAQAFSGIEYAIHVASPIPTRPPRDESELIAPARDGTLRVLREAVRSGLRRVVVTSSISAIHAGHPRDSHVFDESDFSRLDSPMSAYDRSKTVAELAAWDYMKSVEASSNLELAMINPGFVVGPILDRDPGVTNEVILKLVRRELPGLPNLSLNLVDVRDVAELHYRAMVTPQAAGKRICCAHKYTHLTQIAAIVERAGHRVPKRHLPNWLVRLAARFDEKVALIVDDLGKRSEFDSTRARTILGWEPREVESTIRDALRSFRQNGLI